MGEARRRGTKAERITQAVIAAEERRVQREADRAEVKRLVQREADRAEVKRLTDEAEAAKRAAMSPEDRAIYDRRKTRKQRHSLDVIAMALAIGALTPTRTPRRFR